MDCFGDCDYGSIFWDHNGSKYNCATIDVYRVTIMLRLLVPRTPILWENVNIFVIFHGI